MELKISVPELVNLIKEIQKKPARIYEMVSMNVQKEVGQYLSGLMDAELTHHSGRQKYERLAGRRNHHNGGYQRIFCIKGIGEVGVKVPRDRSGAFQTQVLPKSKQYEERIAEDVSDRDKHEDAFSFKQETDWSEHIPRRGKQSEP